MKNARGCKKNKKLRYNKEMIELEEVEDEEQKDLLSTDERSTSWGSAGLHVR